MIRCRTLRLALCACLVTVLTAPLLAQQTAIKVDGNVIKGYITTLAADEQQGRRTLTPGYEKMADWAAGKFREWGVKPAGENGTYFQNVPMTGTRSAFAWTTGIPSLVVGGRAFSLRDNDFVIDSQSTPARNVNAEIVFVGYGISAPAKGLDEYAGVDVKGKIVLALKGSPSTAPDPRPAMGSTPTPTAAPTAPAKVKDDWAEESADQRKALTAYEKGAAAIMLYTPPAAPMGIFGPSPAPAPPAAMMAGLRRTIDQSPFKTPFLYVSNIDDRVFRAAMWRDPQESLRGFSARLARMQSDIKAKKARSLKTGVTAQIKGYMATTLYGEKFKNNIGRNVIGKIEGTDPALKTQYVIAGGHLDHTGMANGVVFNGADDNASGAATTMEIARLLTMNKVQPKRTLIFCLWTGEEQGLNGSNHYVAHPSDGVTMDNVVTYFNMDMVGLGDRIGAPGAMNFPSIYDVITRDQAPDVIGVVDATPGGPGGSDHSAFIERGIEALALMTSGGAGHPDYHDSGDDPSKIEAEILGKTGQFVLQGMLNLGNDTSVNLLIADRQEQYHAMRFAPPDVSGTQSGPGAWQSVRASTRDDLIGLLGQRIKELSGATPAPPRFAMGGRGGGAGRVVTGVRSSSLFGGSTTLLETSASALNFGRVDVPAPDGVWFGDTLTAAGQEALRAMEEAGVVVHLVRPPANLLEDVLDHAKKPILVSEAPALTPGQLEKFKKNNALAIVVCSPASVADCARQTDAVKDGVGKGNVLLSLAGGANRAQAARELYQALFAAGWKKDEIYAAAGVGAPGMMGQPSAGNLSRFSQAPPVSGGF